MIVGRVVKDETGGWGGTVPERTATALAPMGGRHEPARTVGWIVMTNTTPDPTLDRLLRHMAWANAQVVARLLEQPVDALGLTAPQNEWSAGRILAHLANAAQGYATRMEGVERPAEVETPASSDDLAALGARLAELDARLRKQATEPDVLLRHPIRTDEQDRRSTILAQSIHHATEHRAQIAGALATNGNNAIDLDAIDLWEFSDLEGQS